MPPPPGAPFPRIGGFSVDPTRDPTDPWWQTLRERMLAERIVFLSGLLDDDAANRSAMELMTLDATGDDPVRLRVDCGGATLAAALALVDVIDLLGVDVHALCTGQAIGPAVAVVAVSHHRAATASSRFRLVEPTVSFRGRPREIESASHDHASQLKKLCARLARATHQPLEVIEADMRSGRYMTASEALRYGLIDEVVAPGARVIELPRRFGFRPG